MDESLLDMLSRREVWEDFYRYKAGLAVTRTFQKRLRAFIDAEGWADVCRRIEAGERFPLPRRAEISKLGKQKKRVVYTYPEPENTVLKLLTFLLLRRYGDGLPDGVWSFRPGRTAKDAVRALTRAPELDGMWSYKVDVSDYFNSIPIERLTPMLASLLADDPRLLRFLRALLEEPEALWNGAPRRERKGIMAGTPPSAFYADVYLAEMDRAFERAGVTYARYSDDIILFAPTREACEARAEEVRARLRALGLAVNPDKEELRAPCEGWTFLGFSYKQGVIDIAPSTLQKLRGKMRRKARALDRWRRRNDLTPDKAARAFIRVFDRKLLEAPKDSELSWSLWFFPVINTDESLHAIDLYAQDCLRFLLSGGMRTKGRFRVRYEELKKLGYRSLVHEYYEGAERE